MEVGQGLRFPWHGGFCKRGLFAMLGALDARAADKTTMLESARVPRLLEAGGGVDSVEAITVDGHG